MSGDEIRLWRDSLGSFVRDSVFGQATHIALPAAEFEMAMDLLRDASDALAYEGLLSLSGRIAAFLARRPCRSGE